MIKMISIKVMFIFFFILNSYGNNLQGKFYYDGPGILKLRKGDIFKGILEIWPKGKLTPDFFSDLPGKEILGLFYIASIDNMSVSKNNSDVIQIEVLSTLTHLFSDPSLHLFEYKNLKIPVFIDRISVIADEFKGKPSYILVNHLAFMSHKSKIWNQNWPKLVLIFLLFFIFYLLKIYFLKRKNLKSYGQNNITKSEMDSILKPEEREHFEAIYSRENHMKYYFIFDHDSYQEFTTKMNLMAYKKEWTDSDLDSIKKIYDQMRVEIKDGISI